MAPILIEVDFMIIGAKGDLGKIPVPGMTGDWLQLKLMQGHYC